MTCINPRTLLLAANAGKVVFKELSNLQKLVEVIERYDSSIMRRNALVRLVTDLDIESR